MSVPPENIAFPNEAVTTNVPDDGLAVDDENRMAIDENEVTIEAIRDGIVSPGTLQSYIGDILKFLEWLMGEDDIRNVWMTPYGIDQMSDVFVRRENENDRVFRSRKLLQMKMLLREAFEKNIINVKKVTPDRYMAFIISLKGRGNTRHLSNSSYGGKRAALFHLFQRHNRTGFDAQFKTQLGGLFKGFYRTITQHRVVNNNPNEEAVNPVHSDGKKAMSVELYKAICKWLLEFNTIDGVFAYCYLIMTWNLACRAQNTAGIRFHDISWSTCFDALSISFAHSKTDQLGEESKYVRHVYANPTEPIVCPVLSLGVYFTSCFNFIQNPDGYLFPGSFQSRRFGKILAGVLANHEAEVNDLGFTLNDIGTHSIRKGAVSYLSSLPGGPPPAATCIRAGWTMGKIKDVYMRYVTAGDQFVGRCLSLLPILREDFGCSPPYFIQVIDRNWVDDLVTRQFRTVHSIQGLGRLTRMCLASIIYHREWILREIKVNHVFRISCNCLRSGDLTPEASMDKYEVAVTYPWNDNNAFSGIPPHVAILQQVSKMSGAQSRLVDDFVVKLRTTLVAMGVDGGRMSEDYLKNTLREFGVDLIRQIGINQPPHQQGELATGVIGRQIENGVRYEPHMYCNGFHRVPRDWRFPRCGVSCLWRQWWIGDKSRNIPPLRTLENKDVEHIDPLELDEDEKKQRSGNHAEKRRKSRKNLNDMVYVMNFVKKKVEERGALVEEITIDSVDAMYFAVADLFDNGPRDDQKSWRTVVNHLRTRLIT
jgi:hypothetical protein